jgi:hypothetical protein
MKRWRSCVACLGRTLRGFPFAKNSLTWTGTCTHGARLCLRPEQWSSTCLRASELRTNLDTTNFNPRNCRRSRSIAAHNGDRISRDPEAYVHDFGLLSQELNALTNGTRGDPRGDARCEAANAIPRQLRPPADSPQPLPLRDVVHAVEVRGTTCARPRLAQDWDRAEDRAGIADGIRSTDAVYRRTRDTATRNANTSSSRSGSQRWTSSGRPRAARAATEKDSAAG